MKCLEKERARHYASTAELRDDLQHYAGGFLIHARPVTFVGNSWRWYRHNMMVANLIFATLLAIAIGVTAVFAPKRKGVRSRVAMATKRIGDEIATTRAKMILSDGDLRPELVGIGSNRLTEALQESQSVLAE